MRVSRADALSKLSQWQRAGAKVQVGFTMQSEPIMLTLVGRVSIPEDERGVLIFNADDGKSNFILQDTRRCEFLVTLPSEMGGNSPKEQREADLAELELLMQISFPSGERLILIARRSPS